MEPGRGRPRPWSHHPCWATRARVRARHHRGIAIVEAAFITPLFFLVIFGVIEMGLLFSSYLGTSNTTRTSARVASAVGDQFEADLAILEAVRSGSSGISSGELRKVVVFRASGPEGSVPEACKTAPVIGSCNHYTAADLAGDLSLPPDSQQFGCGATSQDRHWCPATRKRDLVGPKSPPDYVGIWVEVHHRYISGVFGRSFTITDQVVMRMEPKRGEEE